MKRYLILILMPVLMMTSGLLASCGETQTGLENRVASLEERLTAAESTILALNQRIELLEKANQESMVEADILKTLQGKTYWASVGNMGLMQIRFGACLNLSK